MCTQRLDLEDNTEVGKGTCAVFDPGTMTVMKKFQQLSVERRIFPAQGRLSHMALWRKSIGSSVQGFTFDELGLFGS